MQLYDLFNNPGVIVEIQSDNSHFYMQNESNNYKILGQPNH